MYSKFNINENLIKNVNEQESLIRDKYSYIDDTDPDNPVTITQFYNKLYQMEDYFGSDGSGNFQMKENSIYISNGLMSPMQGGIYTIYTALGKTPGIIDASGKKLFAVQSSSNLTLQNVGVTNGRGASGIIYVFGDGILNLESAKIYENIGNDSNGVILNDGTLSVSNSEFTANEAQGPATVKGGAISNMRTASIVDSTFKNNTSPNGGAIFNNSSANMTLSNVTFEGNTATNGGALYNLGNVRIFFCNKLS